ncbi:intracellular growth attenuator family protein [Vibrio sp. 99-70-13A1]|nr:intracellular growth attenuator family protein [Vibrio sp. 99-70-13A1]
MYWNHFLYLLKFCWLLAVGCWLLAVGCWLLAVGCWLLLA